jgi:hypothetical protein
VLVMEFGYSLDSLTTKFKGEFAYLELRGWQRRAGLKLTFELRFWRNLKSQANGTRGLQRGGI